MQVADGGLVDIVAIMRDQPSLPAASVLGKHPQLWAFTLLMAAGLTGNAAVMQLLLAQGIREVWELVGVYLIVHVGVSVEVGL